MSKGQELGGRVTKILARVKSLTIAGSRDYLITTLFLLCAFFIVSGTGYTSVEPTYSEEQPDDNVDSGNVSDQSSEAVAGNNNPSEEQNSSNAATMSSSSFLQPPKKNQIYEDWTLKPVQISPAGSSGAAVTSMPIVVPPGRKGMQPNISLGYSSIAGNGWIGVGWNLDMGSIRRNTKWGVNYSGNDYIVAVNGSSSELVPRSDWGANYYGAKIEGTFTKYLKRFNNDDNGWVVITKEGMKYYYGTTSASRQDNEYGTFKWCLDSVEDTNGNYMTVTYSKDQGEIYLDSIDYTANTAGLPVSNYVRFYLEGRNDVSPMYGTNSMVMTSKRLRTIAVTANGVLVRAYRLDYSMIGTAPRSFLTSVTQYGNNGTLNIDQYGSVTGGTNLNPIIFDYTSTISRTNTFSQVAEDGFPSYGEAFYPGDYDGDGKADLVVTAAPGFHGWEGWKLYLSVGNNLVYTNQGGGVSFGDQLYPGDFNGDGKTDFIAVSRPDFHNWQGWKLYLSTGNNFAYTSEGSWPSYGEQFYLGDFNGDGKTDFIVVARDGFTNWGGWKLYLSTGNNFAYTSEGSWPSYGEQFYLGDFNGDVKTDFIVVGRDGFINWGGWKLYLSTGNNFAYTSEGSWPSYSEQFYLGDFNGDGKTDFIVVGRDGFINWGGWKLYLSTGNNFAYTSEGSWPSYGEQFYLGDFNGDGKTDFIVVGRDGFINWGGWKLYWSVSLTSTFTGIPDLLGSVSNGIGATSTLEYLPSSEYDNIKLPFIVQTLSSVTVNDGNGISATTSFDYQGGNFDYEEKEYRGFEYVWVTAPNNTYTETKYYVGDDEDIFKGLVRSQITRDSLDNIYAKTENFYSYTSPYSGVTFPYLYQKEDYAYDGTTSYKKARSSFEYDEYGNITRKHLEGDVNVTGDERDEYTYYKPHDPSKWMVSFPKTVYVLDSKGNTMAQEWFAYDTKGNMLTKESWLDDGPNPVVRYENYDAYGNATRIRDPRGYLTNITYEYQADYLKVTTSNSLGHTSINKYDYGFGNVIESTGPNGYSTTYRYDAFGRTLKVIGPKDSEDYPTMTYEYPLLSEYGQVGVQKVKSYAREQHGEAGTIWSETYFDGLGRTFKTESEGPDRKVIVTRTIYNDRGLVDQTSAPFFKSQPPPPCPDICIPYPPVTNAKYTTYLYDPIGRVTNVIYPDLTFTQSIYYLGALTTIDPNGHQRVEIKDIYGRVIEVQEYTGVYPNTVLYATTIYGYDATGNLEYTRDAQGNETYMVYDTLSRKTAMYEPDMGLWEYEYDDNGNLIYQIDTKDTELFFQYDELNRIKKKIYPDASSIDYQYDQYDDGSSTNAIGRLTELTDLAGTTIYHYDELGNTVQTDKTIGMATYTTQTTYDALGRTETLTYPDNPANPTVIKYIYGTGGNLLNVQNMTSGTVLAAYSNYNALGQIGKIDYGNGITTEYTYYDTVDETNRLKKIKTYVTASPSTEYMSQDYFYDAVGNITQIFDHIDPNKTRTYEYDELSRLIQASTDPNGVYGGNLVYSYDKIGNVTYNCKYGNYYYDDVNHPHAVTRIVRSDGSLADSYAYDLNGNMISGAGRTFTYDYDNRPTSIVFGNNAVASVYDASGKRVRKMATVGSVNKITTYIGDIYECTDGQCVGYIFAGSQRIAKIDNAGNNHFYHTDHLGSSTVMTDDNAVNEQGIFYYPYGEILDNSGTDEARHKFTGQEWDAETGLYYYGARYYDPKLARFISADTIVPYVYHPQSLNRYSYCINNPVILTDSDGHKYELIGAAVGAVIGAIAAERAGGDWWKGAIVGGIAGYTGTWAGTSAYTLAGGSGWFAAMVGGAVGGATGGAVSGGLNAAIYGGNVWRGIGQGALQGAIVGGISAGLADYIGSLKIDFVYRGLLQVGSSGLVGGTAAELNGGNFWDGAAYSAAAALAMIGWQHMRAWTDASSLKGSGAHIYDENGVLLTTGRRKCDGCIPGENSNGFTEGGGLEGEYKSPVLNLGSKVHDFGLGWSYRGTGNFVAGSLSYNMGVAAYNYMTMPIAALYTAVAFSSQPYSQAIIYNLIYANDQGN